MITSSPCCQFDEVLRALDSMQLTAKHQVATPANWQQGDDVIIVPSVSDEQAKEKYPEGWKTPRPYLRILEERVVSSRGRSNERAVKRKMSNYPIALRGRLPSPTTQSFTSIKVQIVDHAPGGSLK